MAKNKRFYKDVLRQARFNEEAMEVVAKPRVQAELVRDWVAAHQEDIVRVSPKDYGFLFAYPYGQQKEIARRELGF